MEGQFSEKYKTKKSEDLIIFEEVFKILECLTIYDRLKTKKGLLFQVNLSEGR